MSLDSQRFLLMTLVLSALASSAGVRRVAVVVIPTEEAMEREAMALEFATTDVLAGDPRYELVSTSALIAQADVARTALQRERALSAVEETASLLDRLELGAARAKAEAAIAELQTCDLRALRQPMLQLLLYLARIKHTLKVDDGGATELTQALLIDAELEAPRGLNTAERAWWARAKRAAEATPKASPVTIEGADGAGWVWVDGRFRGVSPVTVDDVRPGRHFITFVATGAEPDHRSELLGTVARVTFSRRLTAEGRDYRALRASVIAGLRRGETGKAEADLRSWCKADDLVVATLTAPGGLRLIRSSGSSTSTSEVGAVTPRALADAVLEALDRPLIVEVLKPQTEPAAPEARAVRSRTPSIVLLSLAAAAVAVGIILAVTGQMTYSASSDSSVSQVEARQGILKARTLAYGSIGVFGGAALAASAGLVLMW